MLSLKIHRFSAIFSAAVLTGSFLIPGVFAAAGDSPARVVAVRGSVTATGSDGSARQLAIEDDLQVGDVVSTSQRGRIQIMFTDRTTISLGRNTTFEIRDYEFEPAQSRGSLVTHVEQGVFRVVGGAITKMAPENFKVETRTATIGVRGSFFVGRLSGTELTVVFLGGIGIIIDNEAGTIEITRPGCGTIVRTAYARPGAIRRFEVEEIREVLDRLTGMGEEAPGEDDGMEEPGERGPGIPDLDSLPDLPEEEDLDFGEKVLGEEEKSIIGALIGWLEEEATSADQETDQIGDKPGVDPGDPPLDPGYRHNGHAIGIVEGVERRSPSTIFADTIRTFDDPFDSEDWPSDSFHFRTAKGEPGTLQGDGSLELGFYDWSTGPMQFADSSGSRGGGDYQFEADFVESGGDNVDSLSGTIRTADESLGGAVRESGTWWNWGAWDVSFQSDTLQYTTAELSPVAPAAYWIAGVTTPEDYIRAQISSRAVGSYSGGARCIEMPMYRNAAMTEYSGLSSFLVDFNARVISGELDFSAATGPLMDVTAQIHADGRGFLGGVTGVVTDRGREFIGNSSLTGDFFGPTAQSLGGTFDAHTYEGSSYIGVFGADAD